MSQRTLAIQAYGNAFSDDEGDNCDSAHAGTPGRSGEENHAARPGDVPPAKKRKTKLISDLDGKERDVALQEMKNGLKQKVGNMTVVPPSKVSFFSFSSHVVIDAFSYLAGSKQRE